MIDPTLELISVTAGDVIAGRYRLGREVGRGGMGAVFRATQLELGRAVAIKLVLGPAARDATARARFVREARVACLLKHPSAVEVYDFGEHEGVPFLVMELVTGASLLSLIRDEGFPTLRDALAVVEEVADVLATAHALGLVHRDIKPENLICLRGDDGRLRVKLIDFGLAFIEAQGELGRLTAEGILSGTPHYLAPEQAQGEAVGAAADVYALGVVLFFLIAHHLPFDGRIADLLAQHAYTPAPSLAQAAPSCPPALSELVALMLAKPPDARPTAAEVRDALRTLDPDAPVRSSRAGARPPGKGTERYAPSLPFAAGREARVLQTADGHQSPTEPMGLLSTAERFVVATPLALSGAQQAALAGLGIDVRQVALDALGDVDEAAWLLEREQATSARCALVPVVALYDVDDLDAAHALLKAGAADAVPRDADPGTLAKKLARALRRARRKDRI